MAGDGGTDDGDTALALLKKVVADRGSFIHRPAETHRPGFEENSLGKGGLPGIDVGDDAEISDGIMRTHLRM